MGGRKKSEIRVFISLDSSLLGHCGLLPLAKATLPSTFSIKSLVRGYCSALPLLFRPGDSDSLLLLLTLGAYAIPIPFLNDYKSFFINLFSVTQLSIPSVLCWYSDIEVTSILGVKLFCLFSLVLALLSQPTLVLCFSFLFLYKPVKCTLHYYFEFL